MKYPLGYIFFALLFATGCLGSKSNNPVPANLPAGTFTGRFEVIRHKTTSIDSASAIITLTMAAATGYQVTGDTSTLHAGSHGGFSVYAASNTVYFQDQDNYHQPGGPAKIHLNGLYNYVTMGQTFKYCMCRHSIR